MKRIFIISVILLMTALSCSSPLDESKVRDNQLLLSFDVTYPDIAPETKSFGDNPGSDIEYLYVAAFDAAGVVTDFQLAQCSEGYPTVTGSPAGKRYQVTLNVTDTERHLHFIATSRQLSISHTDNEDVIAGMVASDNESVYWQRVIVHCIPDKEHFSSDLTAEERSALGNVALIRNFAKIEVHCEATTFELQAAKVFNVPQKGFFAPYIKSAGKYVDKYNEKSLDNLAALGFFGSTPATAAKTVATASAMISAVNGIVSDYSYELAKPRNDEAPAFVIIKGIYNGKSYFYKLNIVSDDGEKYPLLRNFIYKINIAAVARPGYDTIEEAAQSDGSGDISSSAEVESLSKISNGWSQLTVDYTNVLIQSGDEFNVRYKFIPDFINHPNTVSNGDVTISLYPEGSLGPAIESFSCASSDDAEGYRTVTVKPVAPGAEVIDQKLRIKGMATLDGRTMTIQRAVNVLVSKKFNMEVTCNPKQVARTMESPVDVKIDLPAKLPRFIFPLTVSIEDTNHSLTPKAGENLTMETGKSLLPGNSDNPGYHYIRLVTVEEYDANPEIVCRFKTNTALNASTVYAFNRYFNSDSDFFTNPPITKYYKKITSSAELASGEKYLIVYENGDELTAFTGGGATSVASFEPGKIEASEIDSTWPLKITNSGQNYTLQNSRNYYLYCSRTGLFFYSYSLDFSRNSKTNSISFDSDGSVRIKDGSYNRYVAYSNSGFTYTSNPSSIYLYKYVEE